MKKILLFCVLVIGIINSAKAQNTPYRDTLPWAPEGAMWIYSSEPLIVMKYSKDSTIENQAVKVFDMYSMKVDSFNPQTIPIIIRHEGQEFKYKSNDSVFIYDQGINEFVLLYKFDMQENDVWNIKSSYSQCLSNPSNFYTGNIILEASTRKLNGIEYSIFSANDSSNFSFNYIIPNIGSSSSPFPLYRDSNCGGLGYLNPKYGEYYYDLVCYTDEIRGTLVPSLSTSPSFSRCDSLTNLINDFIISVDKVSLADNKNDKFSIYPNPAHSALNIYTNGVFFKEIMIYDAVGKLVIHDKSQSQNIDISSLNNGLYIINILDDNYQISAFKFVKA